MTGRTTEAKARGTRARPASGSRRGEPGGLLPLLRTVLLVTVLAVLVWLGAESQTLSTETVFVPVRPELPSDVAWRVSDEDQATWTGQVSLRVSGPSGAIARFRDRMTRAEGVPGVPATVPASGVARIDFRTDLRPRNRQEWNLLTVESAEPAGLSLVVERQRTVRLRLEPRYPVERLRGMPTIEPAVIDVALPVSVAERLGSDPAAAVPITDRLLEGVEPGEPSTLNGVPVQLDPEVLGPWRVELQRVSVRLTVAERLAEEIVTLPLAVLLPAPLASDWHCEVSPEEHLRLVRVSGSARQVEQVIDGRARVVAVLRLGREDLDRGTGERAFEVFGLPSGVEWSSPRPTVRFRVGRRSVGGGFYGPTRPAQGPEQPGVPAGVQPGVQPGGQTGGPAGAPEGEPGAESGGEADGVGS